MAAGAVEAIVDPRGTAVLERGDGEANVQTHRARLEPGDHQPLGLSTGSGRVASLGKAAPHRQAACRTVDADRRPARRTTAHQADPCSTEGHRKKTATPVFTT